MGVLIYILIIVFIVVSSNNSKKKKAQSAAKQPQPAVRSRETASERLANAKSGGDFLKALGAMATESVADAVKEAKPAAPKPVALAVPQPVRPVKVASQAAPVFMAAQGIDHADEEGCVGGSMAHTHEEGESHAEHERHMKAAMRRETEESLAAQAALELSEMNIHRLRRAVVVAEILDRPKALRRNVS